MYLTVITKGVARKNDSSYCWINPNLSHSALEYKQHTFTNKSLLTTKGLVTFLYWLVTVSSLSFFWERQHKKYGPNIGKTTNIITPSISKAKYWMI